MHHWRKTATGTADYDFYKSKARRQRAAARARTLRRGVSLLSAVITGLPGRLGRSWSLFWAAFPQAPRDAHRDFSPRRPATPSGGFAKR